MRIAFASCMCTRVYPQQPVWARIAACQPDALVLLGDSIYLDIGTPLHPSDMTDDEFARHLYALYTELLAEPNFGALLASLPAGRAFSIWDDHDFLWNDANGADEAQRPAQRGKIRLSTAFQEAFRAALAAGGGGFPDAYNDARFWDAAQPALATPSIALAPDVMLHLSDGRTQRTSGSRLVPERRRTLLGAEQRARLRAVFESAPAGALHLLASGSTLGAWQPFAQDWQWLQTMAAAHRTLVLSGDIHRNNLDAFFTPGWPLHEATSSGAGVRDAVVLGAQRQNFGLLDIDAASVTIQLFAKTGAPAVRVLDRATWRPA